MHSEPAIESRAAVRGRRRKRGNGSNGPADGPVFVDNSGRRARLLRRIGLLLGAVCIGYAVVLGMAFMGWGTSLTPSSLLPFGAGGPEGGPDGGRNAGPGGGLQPQGGTGTGTGTGSPPARPTGAPPSGAPAAPSAPSASASAPSPSASTSAAADAN
ncbi:hypothetical protein [Streptomyces sp. MMBL 11-3]|uniref:hypothetical protein n=1 Tax=Streptomyces sp. MMBL 11-3 TaxID=3382639 RepID=UPI0039B5C9FF